MNTSILTVVLAGSLLAGQDGMPTWQNSYTKAQEMGASQKKPLAIVIGSGSNGWSKVVREATPATEVTQLLREQYICVYIDSATPAGKKFAADLGITQSSGIILSDRACSLQAFWHQGDLTSQVLAGYLKKYSDPQVVVRGTETASTSRTSFYPSEASESMFGGSGSFGGSSYCPSCNNARGRR